MTPFVKLAFAAFCLLLFLAGVLTGILLSAKASTCSTTVTLNATCHDGSSVTINSTANSTPANPLSQLSGNSEQFDPPKDKIVPAPEFPSIAFPIGILIAVFGVIALMRWRRG